MKESMIYNLKKFRCNNDLRGRLLIGDTHVAKLGRDRIVQFGGVGQKFDWSTATKCHEILPQIGNCLVTIHNAFICMDDPKFNCVSHFTNQSDQQMSQYSEFMSA